MNSAGTRLLKMSQRVTSPANDVCRSRASVCQRRKPQSKKGGRRASWQPSTTTVSEHKGRLEHVNGEEGSDIGKEESRSESNLSNTSNNDSEAAKVSTATDSGEVRFGDRLLDDLMNTFCDRLQAACPRKLDGCLAIQFVLVEPQSLKSMISASRPAQQIIFDSDRVHYVVVDYDPQSRFIVLYDSLVEKDTNIINLLTEPIRRQISALFSHIFDNNAVQVAIARSYDRQTDTWSCGYRSIACMVDLARQRNPCETDYCMKNIFDFFQKVISEPNIEWEAFESANFGQHRPLSENSVTFVRLYSDLAFEEVPYQSPDMSQDISCSQAKIQNMKLSPPSTPVISNIDVDTRSEQSIRAT